jgi:hypothetical protein
MSKRSATRNFFRDDEPDSLAALVYFEGNVYTNTTTGFDTILEQKVLFGVQLTGNIVKKLTKNLDSDEH